MTVIVNQETQIGRSTTLYRTILSAGFVGRVLVFCEIVGSTEYDIWGLMVLWSYGLMVSWSHGLMVFGLMALWSYGLIFLWSRRRSPPSERDGTFLQLFQKN